MNRPAGRPAKDGGYFAARSETIHTESSYKYTVESLALSASRSIQIQKM
jgi:hypothetical protein